MAPGSCCPAPSDAKSQGSRQLGRSPKPQCLCPTQTWWPHLGTQTTGPPHEAPQRLPAHRHTSSPSRTLPVSLSPPTPTHLHKTEHNVPAWAPKLYSPGFPPAFIHLFCSFVQAIQFWARHKVGLKGSTKNKAATEAALETSCHGLSGKHSDTSTDFCVTSTKYSPSLSLSQLRPERTLGAMGAGHRAGWEEGGRDVDSGSTQLSKGQRGLKSDQGEWWLLDPLILRF